MNHDPGDPICMEHNSAGIYTAVVHLCKLCRKCTYCGTTDATCFAAGIWHACCPGCNETDKRSHLSTLPS